MQLMVQVTGIYNLGTYRSDQQSMCTVHVGSEIGYELTSCAPGDNAYRQHPSVSHRKSRVLLAGYKMSPTQLTI